MSLLLLLRDSGPPPEPVTVIGYAAPSVGFSTQNLVSTRNLSGYDLTIDLSDAFVEAGDFCVVVIAINMQPSYMPFSVAEQVPTRWHVAYEHIPSNPYAPHDALGYVVLTTTATGLDDTVIINMPYAKDVSAYIATYRGGLPIHIVSPVVSSFAYGLTAAPQQVARSGPAFIPFWSSVLYVSASNMVSDLMEGQPVPFTYARALANGSSFVAPYTGSEDLDPVEIVQSWDICTLASRFDVYDDDVLMQDIYTVFAEASTAQSALVVCVRAADEGFLAQAEIVASGPEPQSGRFSASAVLRNYVTGRYGSIGVDSILVGERTDLGVETRVTLHTTTDAEIIDDVRASGAFAASAEIERGTSSSTGMQHPRHSLLHGGHTLTTQVVTTADVLDMSSGSVLHDVLQFMWDEQARISSVNRWPLSFSASAEVV